MDTSEETKIINAGSTLKLASNDNPSGDKDANLKDSGDWGKRTAGVASAFVGGIAGAGAAAVADKYINSNEEEVVEEITEAQTSHTSSPSSEPQVEKTENTTATTDESDSIPSDATLVNAEDPIVTAQPASYNENSEDGMVHVVGVEAVQTEDGGQAIVAGIEANGEEALLVDVNSDGTINLFIHDDNGDGVISDNEVHDITAQNIPTEVVIEAALGQQPEMTGAAQLASHNENGEDNMVHVVGVEAVRTEDGGQAIIAGLEANGDEALLVDVNSDGTMNLFVHDDNGDGVISDNEVHDITAENISTEAVIEEALAQQANEDLYYVSDDNPDYMNNADTGFIEA